MSIAKLKLVEIEFPLNKSDDVLSKLINLDNFHPEYASKFADSVHGLSVLDRVNPYADLITRLEEAKEKYHLDLKLQDTDNAYVNVIEADTMICDLLEDAAQIEKVRNEIQIMIDENDSAISQLQYMIDSDLNFDHLFGCKYLKIRVGCLPTENLDKLQYYGVQQYLLRVFHKDPKNTYCLYMTTPANAPVVDNIFSSLYFKRIYIPKFVHGTPEEALEVLKDENNAGHQYIATLTQEIKDIFDKKMNELNRIYSVCKKLNATYDAQKYVVVFGTNASVFGFAQEKDAASIKTEFEQLEDVVVEIKPVDGDIRLTPPTKLKNNWFTKPFGMFVEMYGVPSYTDFDPTNLVAISYTFLFGMMFGDIGQGLVLSLVGYLAYKLKGMRLGEVGIRLGISSALFGIVYGSFFGNEEIFTPMFHVMDSHSTMPLLAMAIGVGVTLIIIAMCCNIMIQNKKGHKAEMLFSSNGIAGLTFYVSVLLFVVKALLGFNIPFVGTTLFTVLFIGVPLLLMFLKEPLERKMEGETMFPHGFGGFFTESFFELFDVILTFIANTMSFLRVGGFVLSHAGMMLVVYTLAKMVNGGSTDMTIAYLIVLIIGNAFVMCLEGMIVGIQVLRLEFYEMFSRYYEGKGKPFQSIKER